MNKKHKTSSLLKKFTLIIGIKNTLLVEKGVKDALKMLRDLRSAHKLAVEKNAGEPLNFSQLHFTTFFIIQIVQ